MSLRALEPLDERLRITTAGAFADLSRSLAQDGLINPPLLQRSAGTWLMISGFRRLAAARQLGWEHLPVRIVGEEVPWRACVGWAIADNALQRPLNIIEVSRALNLLNAAWPNPQERQRLAAAWHLPASPSQVARLLPLATLPPPFQEALLDGRLAPAMALELTALDLPEADRLLHFFSMLRLGLNRQKAFLSLLWDIARREGLTLLAVLKTDELIALYDDQDTERPRRVEQVYRYLRQRRYPHLTAAEARFQSCVKALQWGPEILLQASPAFENPNYTLTLTFSHLGQLASHLDTIRNDLQHPALIEVFPDLTPNL